MAEKLWQISIPFKLVHSEEFQIEIGLEENMTELLCEKRDVNCHIIQSIVFI
jgi:hypothetical protein